MEQTKKLTKRQLKSLKTKEIKKILLYIDSQIETKVDKLFEEIPEYTDLVQFINCNDSKIEFIKNTSEAIKLVLDIYLDGLYPQYKYKMQLFNHYTTNKLMTQVCIIEDELLVDIIHNL